MLTSTNLQEKAWYLVHTKPRQEFRALEQLRNQGYQCVLPVIKVERCRRGKTEFHTEALFTRYLFIALNMSSDQWTPIRNTRGVSGIVIFGDRYACVPNAYIDALHDIPIEIQRGLVPGDLVRINAGPFAGLNAIYELSDGEARAHILIEVMSKLHKLSIDRSVLTKVT